MKEQKFSLLGIEMSPEEFDFLMCEQAQGKELKVVGGKVVAEFHIATEEEIKLNELASLETWFTDVYDAQVKQYERCQRLGLGYDNKYGTIDELDAQAVSNAKRIKELRVEIEEIESRAVHNENN